jgi:hypothetical protein
VTAAVKDGIHGHQVTGKFAAYIFCNPTGIKFIVLILLLICLAFSLKHVKKFIYIVYKLKFLIRTIERAYNEDNILCFYVLSFPGIFISSK